MRATQPNALRKSVTIVCRKQLETLKSVLTVSPVGKDETVI